MSLLTSIQESEKYRSSSSLPHQVVDVEKLSDKEIMKILNRMLPTDVIKIGPFHIYYLIRDLNKDLWNEMLKYISIFYDNACRGELSESYQTKFKDSNLMVLCSTHDVEQYKKYNLDVLNGFLIAKYDIPKREANIDIICFQNLETSKNEKLKISGGLLLHCLGLNIIRQLKIKHVYLEASVENLIYYYYKLGYRLGKERCGEEDLVTDLHDKYPIDKVIDRLPKYYSNLENGFSYPMKWCDFDENDICFESFQKFRENVSLVTDEMLTSDIGKIEKDKYFGPSDEPKKYRVIKKISENEYYGLYDKEYIVIIYLWRVTDKNAQMLKDKLKCIRKAQKFCDYISCYIEHFKWSDDELVVVMSWKEEYESLEDYLSKRLQLQEIDGDRIIENISNVLESIYSIDIVIEISEKNVWISPETLEIYIPRITCDQDIDEENNIQSDNENFLSELENTIYVSNSEVERMNKEIVERTRLLIRKIGDRDLDDDIIEDLDSKMKSLGEDLNRVNFEMNNMIANVYIHSDDIISNIKRLSKIALGDKILTLKRKKKWLRMLNI
jgi:hypothetical protein